MRRIVFGLFLVGGALTVFLVERFANNVVSDGIGRLYCGDDYLAPIAGVVSDASCGFNTDLYLVILLSFLIYVGFTVVMFSLLRRRRLKRELELKSRRLVGGLKLEPRLKRTRKARKVPRTPPRS